MKPLLIISSGWCVWDDVEKAKKLLGDHDTMAVNHMIMDWPDHLTYGASWHFDLLKHYVRVRTFRNIRNRPIIYGPRAEEEVDEVLRFDGQDVLTSGMYAAYIGKHLGYDKIILCGMPFDDKGHYYDKATTDFNRIPCHMKSWERLQKKTKKIQDDSIRAVSGNLIKCFGELTEEWLTS
jgi:hypothetical protein